MFIIRLIVFFDNSKSIIILFNKRNGKLHKSKFFGKTCNSIDIIIYGRDNFTGFTDWRISLC